MILIDKTLVTLPHKLQKLLFLTAIPPVRLHRFQLYSKSMNLIDITVPPGAMWDLHHYETPQFFKDKFNFFDNWQEIAGYPGVTICE